VQSEAWKLFLRGSLLLLSLVIARVHAAGTCKVAKFELPVTMSGMRPLISAKINGENVQFVLDSGAFYSTISTATAAQFKLKSRPLPFDMEVKGVGGGFQPQVTTVKEFSIAGVPLHNVEFLVGGSEVGSDGVGLLGQNFLERWDVEYDLAHGVVRLLKVEDCTHTLLAYWLTPGQSYSMLDISWTTPAEPHTTGSVFINDKKLRVAFDTGAATSMLSLKAAERAGVRLDSPGVVESGYWGGIGRGSIKTYIASFASFKIGDGEEIKNARLRIADINVSSFDMLIGADFFLSHRIYVANSQHKLYFTYNGGAVFNLGNAPAGAASTEPIGSEPSEPKKDADEPGDAAAFARRGAASANRRDYDHALADLTRACELDPNEPDYFYRRGVVYWENKQPPLAEKDFDYALSLKPDFLSALLMRAQLRLGKNDVSGAIGDLDAADRGAPKQADIRFSLAGGYEGADMLDAAVTQYDLWIANHPDDAKMVSALNSRCWARALQGSALDKALDDCNRALSRTGSKGQGYAAILDSRGLVRLRLGDYDKSIADYDASLKMYPKNASSLYGRGIAKLRKKQTKEGEADISAAIALRAKVSDNYTRHGIAP
jgi:tetratricopeptide (TPR) repeat protein/predicted aspartyl protease